MRGGAVVSMTMVATLVAACGFAPDSGPRPIDMEGIRLTETTAPTDGHAGTVEMWFVDGDRLVPVLVSVRNTSPATVVATLVTTPAPAAAALRSAVPPATEVVGAVVEGGVATVDLSSSFTLVGGNEEILAVGQIVLTLSSLEGVAGVRLLIDGSPVAAPTGDGALVDRPLTPDDFAGLVGG